MKLQHLAVIFVIIILPIALVMTQYIQTQINTINMQTLYTQSLNNATHDALKAFQINSVNNKYSSVSDSKIRDVEASVSTFYNSLMTSMDKYVSSKKELTSFVPAIVFTLYDGYYIYSTYENIYSNTAEGKVQINDDNKKYQDGLKPYIYYSCTYKLGNEKIVVNYTLDNSITVYGTLKDTDGNTRYVSKSGTLIDYTKVKDIDENNKTLKYGGVKIEPETLKEHLLIIEDGSDTPVPGDYNYIMYNNKKVYQDVDQYGNANDKYFWYDNYKKTYLQTEAIALKKYLEDNGVGFKSISDFEYYFEAYEFSKWVVENSGLGSVKQKDIVKNDGQVVDDDELYLSINTGTENIFDTRGNNDPMLSSSTFNAHREAVIRKSIETNLLTVIANYNIQNVGSYEFVLPVIDEENWYKISNNISIISFMQGIPILQKYYNNYSVITNTKNEEVVNEQSLYIVAEDSSGNLEYHQPGCKELIEMQKNDSSIQLVGYTSLSFLRQTVKVDESNIHYFYPQARNNKTITGCYNCIVNATADYNIDSLIEGKIKNYKTENVLYSENELKVIRQAYFEAIARERKHVINNNSVEINIAGDVIIEESEPHIHSYSSKVTKAATCTEKGVMTYTCSCGDTYTEEIPMSEHVYVNTICINCGAIDPGHSHNYTGKVTKEATCTEKGVMTYICSCGRDSYTEEIPTIDHNYVNRICTMCGAKDPTPVYLVDEVEIGDYVSYTANGYSKWRVVDKTGSGSSGKVYLISVGNPSKVTVNWTAPSTYIKNLNDECKKYVNSNYAVSARNVGTTSAGGNNSSYASEINSLKNKGLLITGSNYWIGYSREDSSCSSGFTNDRYAYYVDASGTARSQLWGSSGSNITYGIRPIVTLKSGIQVDSGGGSIGSPYVMKIN